MQRLADGSLNLVGFDFIKDTRHDFSPHHSSLSQKQKDVLMPFLEAGILKFTAEADTGSGDHSGKLEAIKDILVECDIKDVEFNRLSGTFPAVQSINRINSRTITVKSLNDGTQRDLILDEPDAVVHSRLIAANFLCSEKNHTAPVFPHECHRRLLAYRYEQYKAGVELLRDAYPSIVEDIAPTGAFGEVAFAVGSHAFSGDLLLQKTSEEILKYRGAMEALRQEFVSQHLLELTDAIEESPWSSKSRKEIETYIRRKLEVSLKEYENTSIHLCDKLFGNLATRGAEVITYATGGGFLGSVIPGASPLAMVLFCAMAAITKQAPSLISQTILSSPGDRDGIQLRMSLNFKRENPNEAHATNSRIASPRGRIAMGRPLTSCR